MTTNNVINSLESEEDREYVRLAAKQHLAPDANFDAAIPNRDVIAILSIALKNINNVIFVEAK